MTRLLLILYLPLLLYSQITDYSTNLSERNFYVSILAQYGPGFEKIKTGQEFNVYSNTTSDIYIRPGGGYGIEAILGSDIIPSIALELGLGLVQSGKVIHTEHIVFNKSTIRASLLYKIKMFNYYTFYVGGGYSAAQNPLFKIEQVDETFKSTYSSPKGFHAIGGVQFNYTSNFFWYGDLKYYSLGEYQIKNATFAGESIPIDEVESEFHSFNADGLQISLGIGYYIK